MTDSSGHPDLDHAVPNLSDDHKLIALKSFQSELENWNSSTTPTATGFEVEAIEPGHPVILAGMDLARFYDGRIPKPAYKHWRRLLEYSRDDDARAEDECDKLLEWVGYKIDLNCDVSPPDPSHSSARPVKPKRSTERGDAQAKLIAALTKHHKYADGGCLNFEPIGVNQLARVAEVSKSTASEFFKEQFGGHKMYRQQCGDTQKLVRFLKVLNGEFLPPHFYGNRSPEKLDWDQEY